MNTVLSDPAKMITKGAPRVIHNDKELEVYTNTLFQLTALEDPSSAEVEAIELLTLLVERYEQAHDGNCIRFWNCVVRLLVAFHE